MSVAQAHRRLGVAVVGLGGAVATTAVAGIEVIKKGANRLEGLPLAEVNVPGLTDYRDMVFGGWDLDGSDLASAAAHHKVLTDAQMRETSEALSEIKPFAAVGSGAWCKGVTGRNARETTGHRAAVEAIAKDLERFRRDSGVDRVVMINLASTERMVRDGEIRDGKTICTLLYAAGFVFGM